MISQVTVVFGKKTVVVSGVDYAESHYLNHRPVDYLSRDVIMAPPRKWGPHKKMRRRDEEDPVKEVMKVVAKGKELLEEDILLEQKETEKGEQDVLLEQQLVDGLEGSDYYDNQGKIATVRRKKRKVSEKQEARPIDDHGKASKDPKNAKRQRRKIKNIGDRDPQGRSFYYSTYRGKDFSPDHWRKQLPKKLLDEVAKEPACKEVMAKFGYPER